MLHGMWLFIHTGIIINASKKGPMCFNVNDAEGKGNYTWAQEW